MRGRHGAVQSPYWRHKVYHADKNPIPAAVRAGGGKKQKETKLGLTAKKDGDFSEWYSQVVVESEMISYYDVSGALWGVDLGSGRLEEWLQRVLSLAEDDWWRMIGVVDRACQRRARMLKRLRIMVP